MGAGGRGLWGQVVAMDTDRSICKGVGERRVSVTSQFRPFTHMAISSSDVAKTHKHTVEMGKKEH